MELKNIQSNSPTISSNEDKYSNAIASHEQRLLELEDEIRSLNGNLEQINFKIDNIFNALKDAEFNQLKSDDLEENDTSLNKNDFAIQSTEKETTIIEDPNIKNPSMKVLGTVNESLNQESFEENTIAETKGGAQNKEKLLMIKLVTYCKTLLKYIVMHMICLLEKILLKQKIHSRHF